MPKILLLFLIGGVVLPLLSYAFVLASNWSLKWSAVATHEHIGKWIWNILGSLAFVLALFISIKPILIFRVHVANQHGMIAGYLFLIACIIPYALLLKHAFKLNEKAIEVKSFSAPISHAITLLWTWISVTLFLLFEDISKYFDSFAQLIVEFG